MNQQRHEANAEAALQRVREHIRKTGDDSVSGVMAACGLSFNGALALIDQARAQGAHPDRDAELDAKFATAFSGIRYVGMNEGPARDLFDAGVRAARGHSQANPPGPPGQGPGPSPAPPAPSPSPSPADPPGPPGGQPPGQGNGNVNHSNGAAP